MAHNPKQIKPGLAARKAALALLRGVLQDHIPLSDLLSSGDVFAPLNGPDRARAQRLALETLRHLSKADALLDRFVKRTPPPEVQNTLRLACVELCVDGAAPHGVVDGAVTLLRDARGTTKFSGLANAVLRKVTQDMTLWDNLPPPRLAKWLRRRLVHVFNEEIVTKIEAAHARGAPLDLTLKPEHDPADWATKLDAQLLPTGSLRLAKPVQVTDLSGFETGDWWVQDTAAAMAVRLLAPQKGETILDLCAAPGGKTMQLAAAGAHVTALDMSTPRMARVRENLTRTKLHAELVVADALHWTPSTLFDAILLDAPCSATGTIRRHPDLPFVKTGKDLDPLFQLQSQLIDKALDMLKPGGRLVFCTCSLLPEEGERQAKQALARHNLSVLQPDPEKLGISAEWCNPDGGIRLRPDYLAECGGMDGFFMIMFQKSQSPMTA